MLQGRDIFALSALFAAFSFVLPATSCISTFLPSVRSRLCGVSDEKNFCLFCIVCFLLQLSVCEVLMALESK